MICSFTAYKALRKPNGFRKEVIDMNNIVLTSCGIRNDDFKNKFYNIVGKQELNNKKVLYITTASDGETGDE